MSHLHSMRDRCRRGFTLVELMAAMTILVLIGLIAGSLTLYVLSGSNTVQRRAESDAEGRGFMTRIAYDLQTVFAQSERRVNRYFPGVLR